MQFDIIAKIDLAWLLLIPWCVFHTRLPATIMVRREEVIEVSVPYQCPDIRKCKYIWYFLKIIHVKVLFGPGRYKVTQWPLGYMKVILKL